MVQKLTNKLITKYCEFNQRKRMSLTAILMVLGFIIFISGCDGDDIEIGSIGVCNFDNRGYYIEICRDSDDRVLESFFLDAWYHFADNCEAIHDFESGNYYIVTYEEETNEKRYSETFFLDGGEFEEFIIDETGKIERE